MIATSLKSDQNVFGKEKIACIKVTSFVYDTPVMEKNAAELYA